MSVNEIKTLKKLLVSPEVVKHFRSLRAIAGSSRLRILYLLVQEQNSGLTITDISKILNASLSRVSHQMRILKKAGLVTSDKHGRNVMYAPVSDKIKQFVILPE